MTTIQVKFRHSAVAGRKGSIYYQLIKNRKVKLMKTDFHLLPCEWEMLQQDTVTSPEMHRSQELRLLKDEIKWHITIWKSIIEDFGDNDKMKLDDMIEIFRGHVNNKNFFGYMLSIIHELHSFGKEGTAKNYRSAYNSFLSFCERPILYFSELSIDLIGRYQQFLIERGVIQNSISFYMRILRAVYNRAVNDGLTTDVRPFKRASTGIYPTGKRALTLESIKKIKKLNLSSHGSLCLARDLFMLSFYLRGMSFIDMAYLRKSDLKNNHIEYYRRKTGKYMQIEWDKEMGRILAKYNDPTSEYLLPILRHGNQDRKNLHSVYSLINRNLKKLGETLGLHLPLTLYVARHSWASIAKSIGIPVNIISDGLGHDSEATTQIYLKSLESDIIHAANARIIASV